MLQLLKKNSEKPGISLVPAWHPNFRNFERLPDTKVVRTSFFLNGVAVSVALALLLYVIRNEYNLYELSRSTEELQAQIDSDKPVSDRASAQYAKFVIEEKKLTELNDFKQTQLIPSQLLLQFGESISPGIKLASIDYQRAAVSVNVVIDGSPDEASGKATAYVEALRKFPPFAGMFESVVIDGLSRNSNNISLKLIMKFKAPTKGAKK